MISVLLVDDHGMVREGLKYYLDTEDDVKVVGEAGDGQEAAEKARKLTPDVILMDLMMPGVDGVEGTELCLEASPDSKVVVLTSKAEDDLVLPAIKAGALSYLLKDVSAEELATAVRDAAAGKATFHPVASVRMARAVSGEQQGQDLAGRISPRELEVLNLIAEGYGNREIGERLFISERTVKSHVTHLLEKLELRDRTQLAIYALRNNLAADK